ncbi:MAG: mannose-1-phosphate guanylyltransferase/mannose-6-phosphate isomerase [Flavobacteriaceae bacterium]|nr:mannose-1-phosphate guanylyltransferase/mannose-6-phosphate isomerase [Flavobacteriaceae bacterium]
MRKIMPVILCGGVGSRLWPLSRKSLPKQFAQLLGNKSLFEAAMKRVDTKEFSSPLIVTSRDHRFLVEKQLRDCGCSGTILLEPTGKNTAPAVFAAAHHVMKQIGDELLLVMPSDHHIPDQDAFVEMVLAGCEAARNSAIVTFGVSPNRPETGFGYIELGDSTSSAVSTVKKFHEKPDFVTAQKMFDAGNYAWNAGIFLFRTSVMLAHAKTLQPDMLAATQEAVDCSREDNKFRHINRAAWAKIQGQSIDYAILEKTDQIACVKFQGNWSDLGDWNAVAGQLPRDDNGNFVNGAANQIDCHNTTLWSSASDIQLVGLGLENVVTVAMDDAVLVVDASRLQDVRQVVEHLKLAGVSQADQHARDYRPWGWFESLVSKPGYQVKRLHVFPGAALSLQSHKHRSEHWVVVSGRATVVRDQETLSLSTNESVYIHVGQKHRLANETDQPLTVIEVQTGSYLGEDDITRYFDQYDR